VIVSMRLSRLTKSMLMITTAITGGGRSRVD
jgi:hypothetical protein